MPPPEDARDDASSWIPLVIALLLLAATAAAFVYAERQKLTQGAIREPRVTRLISPVCDCYRATARVKFVLAEPQTVTARIVGDGGSRVVRTLADHEEFRKGRVELEWDGRTEAGIPVAEGRYRVWARLEDDGRVFLFPQRILVDITPPRATIARVAPRVLTPNRDGVADWVTVAYRLNERGSAFLFVDGRRVKIGRPRLSGNLRWNGRMRGRPVPPGEYELSLAARDPAGNGGKRTPPWIVTVVR